MFNINGMYLHKIETEFHEITKIFKHEKCLCGTLKMQIMHELLACSF